MDTIADWVTSSCQNRNGECFCGSRKSLSAKTCCSLGGWVVAETSVWQIRKTQMNQGHDFSLYHSQVSVWLYGQVSLLGGLTDFRGNFVLLFVLRARVTESHMTYDMWHMWCIKHAFLWVQQLICLLGTPAFLEDVFLFHVLMETEFQGGRSEMGRQEECSPCSSLGSCCGCTLQSTYQDEDDNSHRR